MMEITISDRVIEKTIERYGKKTQSVVCMEECAELSQAVSKLIRGGNDLCHLTEEMADVLICIEMLKVMYGIDDKAIMKWIQIKQNRIMARMEADKWQ